MFKNAFYICMAMVISVVSSGATALATEPVMTVAQNYSHKFITPIYQDRSSRFTQGNWTNIGCQRADNINGRYVMDVERNKGPFDKLRLKISSVDFHVVGIKVVFYNGQRARLAIRSEDSFPGRGVVLDLPGRKRNIKKIILKYGSRNSSYRPIVVCIDGHEVEQSGYNNNNNNNNDSAGDSDTGSSDDYGSSSDYAQKAWKDLGCVKAKHNTKSRYIQVGRSKGRFKAFRLKNSNHAVRIKSLSVTFENGRTKNIPNMRFLKRRSVSDTISFNSRRFIKVVDIRLKINRFFGSSWVCLQGLAKSSGGGYQDQNDDYNPRKWRSLGCKAFRRYNPTSKFVIVGRREGRFKELRLTVSGSSLGLDNLGVVYGNGRDGVLVRSNTHVRRGTRTRSYRLSGHKRYIKEVEIVGYKKGRNSAPATVCVQGR